MRPPPFVTARATGIALGQEGRLTLHVCPSGLLVTVRACRIRHRTGAPAWSCLELVVSLVVVVLIVIVATTGTGALVVLLDDRAADALDLLLLLLDLLRVRIRVRGQPILAVLDRIVHGLLLVLIHLLTEALVLAGAFHSRLHGVKVVVERVARVDLLLQRLVLLRELLSLLDHALDLLLRQATLVVRDGDLLRVASALVLRTDHQDAVAVNLERHLDLRNAARRRRNARHVELAELVVVLRHRALTLVHLNGHRRLVVLVRREHLRLLRRDHRVARDELGHHAADRLDTERERGDVEEQEVRAALAGKDSRLHSRAVRNSLVRVDATVRLLAVEEVLHQRLDLRDARGPAHEHDLVHLRLLQAGVVHDVLHRAEGLLEEVRVQLLEARARQGLREVNAVEERLDLQARLVSRRKRALRLLHLATELLDGALVLGHVLLVLLLEHLHEVLHDTLVEVLTAQVGVAVGRNDLEHAVVDGQQRHIEGAAAQVVDEDVLLRLLVEAVRDSRRRRLVDDAEHLHAGDGAGILRRLALRIVEVRRDRDHGVLHLLPEVRLSNLLHLREHHRRHLLRGELLLLTLHLHADHRLAALVNDVVRQELLVALHALLVVLAADEALHVEQRLRRVDGRLVLRGLTDQALILRERDVRRGDA